MEKRFLIDSDNPFNGQNLLATVFFVEMLVAYLLRLPKTYFVNQVWTFSFIGLITWFD